MKKISLFLAGSMLFFQAGAQLINPGFEILNDSGRASNWKPALFFAVPIDSSCTWSGLDSICFVTPEAHTGKYALEMRVASYCDYTYGGNIKPTKDDSDTAFFNQSVPFRERPPACTFFYKLHPVQGDVAKIQVMLDAEDGTPIADAYLTISHAATTWTRATLPLVYQNNGTPAFLNMRFEIDNDSIMHSGSRFLIDDILYESATVIARIPPMPPGQLNCYPVPAQDQLFIQLPEDTKATKGTIHIMDVSGKMVKNLPVFLDAGAVLRVPVKELPQGIYFLNVTAGTLFAKGKFIK